MQKYLIFAILGLLLGLMPAAFAQVDNSGPNCSELANDAEVRAAAAKYGAETYDADGDGYACQSDFPPNGVRLSASESSDSGDALETPTRIDAGAGGAATEFVD